MLFDGLHDERFYFVHSYGVTDFPLDAYGPFRAPRLTWAEHGQRFVAAVENGPLTATQFHPRSPASPASDCSATGCSRSDTRCARAGRPPGRNDRSIPSNRRDPDRTMTDLTDTPPLVLLPAVDVVDGQAVRLTQGEAGSETSYGDPVAAARTWREQGAEWIHLVDLDAAFGRGDNRKVIAHAIKEVEGVSVELSGGIRDDASLEAALETGAARVNLGTAALEHPEWAARVIGQYGEQIAVGLDVRGTTLASRGWTQDAGDLWEVLDRLEAAGCARYVVTDVTKDGTLQGPNTELLRAVCERTSSPSWPPVASRRSTTCAPSASSSRTASRARSSARRSTPAPSRCPPRSTSPASSAVAGISNGRGTGPDDAGAVGGQHPDDAHTPGGAADSAGFAWAGRTFDHHDTAFADDDGLADPGVVAAISALPEGGSQRAVVDALRSARLLIPLVADAGDLGHTDDGRLVDKTQELSIVTVAGPDGRKVMPAFTSVEAMRSWDPDARPVPVESRRVAMAAASEETQLVVLDPTAPTEFVLRRPAVWALGQDLPWTPCHEDPEVAEAFAASVADEGAVARVELVAGDPLGRFAGAELTVGLVLHPGLDQAQVQALVGRLQQRWTADAVVSDRVDSMRVALRRA